jgi:hypothetical protein
MSWKRYIIPTIIALVAGSAGGVLVTAWMGGKQVSRADAVTVIVAALAAVFVAWQSYETRRSANGSLEAAKSANKGLELARQEERHSRTLIAEAIRSRIDAGTQSLTLIADDTPEWPPREPSIIGGEPNPIGTNHIYRMPRDQEERIVVRQGFNMLNQGPRLLKLGMGDWFEEDAEQATSRTKRSGTYVLRVGEVVFGHFEVERSLSEWVANAILRTKGVPGQNGIFQISISDDADTGAIDHYEITVGGVPIEPVEGEDGGWRILATLRPYGAAFPSMTAVALPRQRNYYLSKIDNLPLDSPRAIEG